LSIVKTVMGVLAALVALLATTACGSDDSSSSAESTAPSASTSPAKSPSGTPIKLAALIDSTGPNSGGQGESIPVLQAWVKDVNARGGIAGHPVSVQVYDTKDNPSKAASFAQEAIADKSVVGAISFDQALETNTLKTLSKAGVPVLGGPTADPGVWGTTTNNKYLKAPPMPGVYQTVTAFPATIAALIDAAQHSGLKNMISVNFSQVPASKNGSDLANAIAKSAGINASSVTVDASAPNFTAECLRVIQQKADYVTFQTPPTLAARVIRDCVTQGYKGAFGAVGGSVTADVYKSVGDNKLIGAWFAFPSYSETNAGDRYRKVMAANQVATANWQGAYGPTAWASMELFGKTLNAYRAKLGDTVTRQDVLAAYGNVKGETLDGMLPGPVTYTKDSVTPAKCYWLFSYEKGKFTGSSSPVCPAESLGAG
jgi:branched-chain amino acid transport system substrate-binding protein